MNALWIMLAMAFLFICFGVFQRGKGVGSCGGSCDDSKQKQDCGCASGEKDSESHDVHP